MPALGMAQETGKLLAWFKTEGQQVVKGEPLMEIETDKVTVSIEAPQSGVLANVVATAGQDVPVGQAIALILAPGEKAPPRVAMPASAPKLPTPSAPVAPARQPVAQPAVVRSAPQTAAFIGGRTVVVNASHVAVRMASELGIDLALVKPAGGRVTKEDVLDYIASTRTASNGGHVLASPKAKRLAKEIGVDLHTLFGSGPQGAVLAIDVLPLAGSPVSTDQEHVGQKLSNLWRVMADHVTQSWQDVPQFILFREVDASNLVAARDQAQKKSEAKITFTDLLVKLAAQAIEKHPNVNASWGNRTIIANESINVGLAVGVEDGLVVPVIQHSNKLNLSEIAVKRIELVKRANEKALQPADIQGGTFTISNLGMYGIDSFTAIVNAPQAAILAVGRIVERVVPVDGQPAVRPMLGLTLTCDHRVLDGLRGAQFLDTLAKLIEAPAF